MKKIEKKIKRKFSRFLRILGPGLITGAADDDPSGIATYSQAGAQLGFGQLWLSVFTVPLMIAVQDACSRIGAVTGKGIAAVVKENYSKKILFFIVFLLVGANTINIGADIGAMASAASLIFPIPFVLLAIFFTVFILVLEIFTSYTTYAKILKWLALGLIAYPITAIIAGQNWTEVIRLTFIPNIEFSAGYFFILTGFLGTSITPYMFFWQASEEVEEEISKKIIEKEGSTPKISKNFIKSMRIDTTIGMFLSQLTAWFIMITTASVLHTNGITNITTAADAAKALEPLVSSFPNSGFLAKSIFAFGIIGLGLLAIPVLAGSASYALSESFNWKEGLNLKLKQARGFYGVIIVAMLIGLVLNFIGVDPIRMLLYTALINGIVAIPLIFIIGSLARDKRLMGEFRSGKLSNVLIWVTFSVMTLSAFSFFWFLIKI